MQHCAVCALAVVEVAGLSFEETEAICAEPARSNRKHSLQYTNNEILSLSPPGSSWSLSPTTSLSKLGTRGATSLSSSARVFVADAVEEEYIQPASTEPIDSSDTDEKVESDQMSLNLSAPADLYPTVEW